MTRQKSNRIFLGIVTGAMAFAGTGLTIANNIQSDFLTIVIALCLGACFTMAEVTFLWGHKRFEDAKKLWRKIVLSISLAGLVGAMGFAFWEELNLVLAKISNKSFASESAVIVKQADKANQRSIGRMAVSKLFEGKIKIDALPFLICYLMTGFVSISILASSEPQRIRSHTYGNQLPYNPALQEAVRQIGFNPETAKAYRDNRERGHAIHVEGRYKKFVSDKELSKYP